MINSKDKLSNQIVISLFSRMFFFFELVKKYTMKFFFHYLHTAELQILKIQIWA